MVENMVEAMENEEKELPKESKIRERGSQRARNVELYRFYEQYGTLNSEMCLAALSAIKKGANFYLTSSVFRMHNPDKKAPMLSGKELKDWGLDLDTLLCPEPKKGTPEYHARRIL